jgi:hypothetical protein
MEFAFLSNSKIKKETQKSIIRPFAKKSSSYTTHIQFCLARLLYYQRKNFAIVLAKKEETAKSRF